MNLTIDVYYKNKETGKYQILHDKVTEDDITELIKKRNKDSLPIWMDKNWEFDSINVAKVDL